MIECKSCGDEMDKRKSWGYANVCEDCDEPEKVSKHIGVIIADGKTDYGVHLIRNPSKEQVEMVRALGKAVDPFAQLSLDSNSSESQVEE